MDALRDTSALSETHFQTVILSKPTICNDALTCQCVQNIVDNQSHVKTCKKTAPMVHIDHNSFA